jgi:hypothetical protein
LSHPRASKGFWHHFIGLTPDLQQLARDSYALLRAILNTLLDRHA